MQSCKNQNRSNKGTRTKGDEKMVLSKRGHKEDDYECDCDYCSFLRAKYETEFEDEHDH